MSAETGPATRVCVRCQKELRDDANVCPHCGRDYRPVMLGHAWEEEKTPLPPVGGAMIALSGTIQIMSGLLWLFAYGLGVGYEQEGYENMYIAAGTALMIVGAFAVLVSAYAMTRRRLRLSLAGGLAALGGGTVATVFAVSIAASSLGLVGLLLVALARDEFVD